MTGVKGVSASGGPSAVRGGGAGSWIVGALAFCLVLSFAKPAVLNLLDTRRTDQLTLNADFGIPVVRWLEPTLPDGIPPEIKAKVGKWPGIGLDFKCVDVYVRCAGPGRRIYTEYCPGDPGDRKFLYPPLMAWAFVWVRWLPEKVALGLWCGLILIMTWVTSWGLARLLAGRELVRTGPPASQLALVMTLFSPVLFAFERGNNDAWIMILYGVAAAAWLRDRVWLAGFCIGIAAMAKLYPAALWLGGAIAGLVWLTTDRRKAAGWLAGLFVGAVLPLILLAGDYKYFLTEHFFAGIKGRSIASGSAWDHSLVMSYGPLGGLYGVVLWSVGVAALCQWVRRKQSSDVALRHALLALLFIGALTTYLIVGTESFDYNLVTLVPLFVLLAYLRPVAAEGTLKAGVLFWVLGAGLPRWVNWDVFGFAERSFSVLLVMQVIGMTLVAVYLMISTVKFARERTIG